MPIATDRKSPALMLYLPSEQDQCTSKDIGNYLAEIMEVYTTFPIARDVDILLEQPSERRSPNFETKEVDITGTRRQEMAGVAAGGEERKLGRELSQSKEGTRRPALGTKNSIERTALTPPS